MCSDTFAKALPPAVKGAQAASFHSWLCTGQGSNLFAIHVCAQDLVLCSGTSINTGWQCLIARVVLRTKSSL